MIHPSVQWQRQGVFVCVCVCVQAKGTEHVVSKPFKADQPSNNNLERNKEKGIHKVHK